MDFEDAEVLTQIIETFKDDRVWTEDLTLSENNYEYYLNLTKMKKVEYTQVYQEIK